MQNVNLFCTLFALINAQYCVFVFVHFYCLQIYYECLSNNTVSGCNLTFILCSLLHNFPLYRSYFPIYISLYKDTNSLFQNFFHFLKI